MSEKDRFTFEDLKNLYEREKLVHKKEVYKQISKLLKEAKKLHKKAWLKNPTPKKDHEQSWKAWKGKNLEKLIKYIIQDEVKSLGLKIASGNSLERKKPENLTEEESKIKRNVSINYGKFGLHLPDADLIIYDPMTTKIIAILSSKSTLRERIAETAYWKIKISDDPVTRNIKVLFITPDEDGDLTISFPTKKGRAICEVDIDGTYVMSETQIEENKRVKMFDKFIEDLKDLLSKK